MKPWMIRAYQSKLISRILHTPVYCVQRELESGYSLLDLGCGPDSLIQHCNVRYSVGVDAFGPFLEASQAKKIHDQYLLSDITRLDFAPKSFDAVILIEVLEHLSRQEGEALLTKAEGWAAKKIILSTPNGFLPQSALSRNPFEVHRSGWDVREMRRRGYKAYGISGWKALRKENTSSGYGATGSAMYATLRFRPYLFWNIVSGISQIFTYYFPEYAYEVFYVKEMKEK